VDLHYILGGAIVGLIVGATGVGGGSLMTPLLTLVFNVPAQIAVGTDLLFAAITKSGGAVAHARNRNVQWNVTGWLAVGSVPAAFLTLATMRGFALGGTAEAAAIAAIIKVALGGALLATAGALVLRDQIRALGARFAQGGERGVLLATATTGGFMPVSDERSARPLPTAAVGVVLGVLVTLTSVGAGVLGVVALYFLYPRLQTRQIVGIDIAHAVPLTLVAGLGHATLGTVNWSLLGSLVIGSLPAIVLGASLSSRLPERLLRILLALLLTGIGAKLVLG